ncbi:MAG: aminomethyl-transferring glycine dehydrogenase subunit GcvPB, partial [Gammaproteobacteria bacterium]
MLIFEKTSPGRHAVSQWPQPLSDRREIPGNLLRNQPPELPAVSELDVVRHYTRLSQKNYSIDTHFYPLGSCTMKYNPKICHTLAMLPGIVNRHPETSPAHSQGFMACMFELQEMLKAVTGMHDVALSPMAGAQGEFAGIAMIRAYHDDRNDTERREIIIPDAAHGTNPASAVMCGYRVREIPTRADGDLDIEALRQAAGPQTAG